MAVVVAADTDEVDEALDVVVVVVADTGEVEEEEE